jgi:prevent-host-death family protein
MEINVKEARRRFADMISRAERGEEVILIRNGKAVAKLVPTEARPTIDPDELAAFRDSLDTPGDLPNAVLLARQETRY